MPIVSNTCDVYFTRHFSTFEDCQKFLSLQFKACKLIHYKTICNNQTFLEYMYMYIVLLYTFILFYYIQCINVILLHIKKTNFRIDIITKLVFEHIYNHITCISHWKN